MKTKERILQVSLRLFNELGIANLAAIDVANEMEISPGNLYYHYKGKGEILVSLLERYEDALQKGFLIPLVQSEAGSEDSWLNFYALAELMYQYRFLFRSLTDIREQFPEIHGSINRILLAKIKLVTLLLASIATSQAEPSPDEREQPPLDVALILLLNWFNYREMAAATESPGLLIQGLMVRFEGLLRPYCSPDMQGFMRLSNENYYP